MKDTYVCCFTGHRKIDREDLDKLNELLDRVIEKLTERGTREFRAGGALGFDTLAALAVLKKREKYPQIRLHLMLPCKDQAAKWSDEDRQKYEYILKRADEVTYTSEKYTSSCMLLRDRRLVEGSDFCIAYCKRDTGGTAYTLSYAKEMSLSTLNIAMMI